MKIDLSQVTLKPILSSVQRLDISDEVYFGPQYKHYISNSRLKLIDPTCNGSPSTYKTGFTGKTTGSLSLGSNIHMLYLQPEEFELVTDVTLPNGKLGLACEKAIKHYKKGGKILLCGNGGSAADCEHISGFFKQPVEYTETILAFLNNN